MTAAENSPQLRSQSSVHLDVVVYYASAPVLLAALLDACFEQPE